MLNKLQNEWRGPIIFSLLITMLVSVFFSRALLSVSMICFVAYSFFHTGYKEQIRNFFASPLLWGMSLLFLLPLVSGLWSEDKTAWMGIMRIKLPLFMLPLAFAASFGLPARAWEWIAFIFIGLVCAGAGWSLYNYLMDINEMNEGYLRAKSIITPLDNDHVRFSWLVTVAILLAGWLWISGKKYSGFSIAVFTVVIAGLIIFLHILAARTGLFSFYLAVGMVLLWLLVKKKKILQGILIIVVLVCLPLTAYFILPTFHNRVQYILYDIDHLTSSGYLPGSNDGVRMISMKAGWEILNQHPIAGVGFGDVYHVTQSWYSIHYSAMQETDRIYPSSEWMIYGAGCGWLGLLMFTGVMLIPFLLPMRDRLIWWLLNLTAAFSFMFDIGLEVQFGVFVYAFIILCCWKWWKIGKT